MFEERFDFVSTHRQTEQWNTGCLNITSPQRLGNAHVRSGSADLNTLWKLWKGPYKGSDFIINKDLDLFTCWKSTIRFSLFTARRHYSKIPQRANLQLVYVCFPARSHEIPASVCRATRPERLSLTPADRRTKDSLRYSYSVLNVTFFPDLINLFCVYSICAQSQNDAEQQKNST